MKCNYGSENTLRSKIDKELEPEIEREELKNKAIP